MAIDGTELTANALVRQGADFLPLFLRGQQEGQGVLERYLVGYLHTAAGL